MGRMTLQGALRYDHAWSYFPEQTVGPVRFFPTAKTYPHTKGVEGYHDLWPRGGVAYDRVRERQDVDQGQLRPLPRGGAERRGCSSRSTRPARLSTTATRAWTDSEPQLPSPTAIC